MPVCQCNCSKPKGVLRADLMKWHSIAQEGLVDMSAGSEAYGAKRSCFLPSQRFNVDQSPVPFVFDSKKTYEIIKPGDKHQKTWISQPASRLEIRQCTLQVCTWADGK